MNARRNLWQVFRWPLLIALLSLAGLLSALVSDDTGDVLAWALLSVPLAVSLHKWRGT